MIEQGGIQFLSLKGNTGFVGVNVRDDAGNDLTVKLSHEQLKLMVIEASKVLIRDGDTEISKTTYSDGGTQYTINDY
jgi:hypothetical protein